MSVKLHTYSGETYLGTSAHAHLRDGLNFYAQHGWSVARMARKRGRLNVVVRRTDEPTVARTLEFTIDRTRQVNDRWIIGY